MDTLKSIQWPTIDRPFAVEIWPYFDRVYTSIIGYSANKFVFVAGATPMSTFRATATMLITYYVTVFAGREFMKKREPFNLNGLFMVHNLILTAISGILLALFIEQLAPTVWRNGIFYAICDHRGGWTAQMVALYYLNYLTKYLELLDTVFMVLKKKPLSTLLSVPLMTTQLICLSSLPPHLPPRRNSPALLHSTHRLNRRLLGAHNTQPDRTRSNVLVLFPSRSRGTDLVEKVHHHAPNPAIRARPRLRLLRILHLLQQYLLPILPHNGNLRRGGIRRVRGYGHLEQLFAAIHQFLSRDV